MSAPGFESPRPRKYGLLTLWLEEGTPVRGIVAEVIEETGGVRPQMTVRVIPDPTNPDPYNDPSPPEEGPVNP